MRRRGASWESVIPANHTVYGDLEGFTVFNFERGSPAELVINVCGAGGERQEFCSET